MGKRYSIKKDGVSLVAKLIEKPRKRVEIEVKDPKGDQTNLIIQDGFMISTYGILANGTVVPHEIEGCRTCLNKYGPTLREKIPPQWYEEIGSWLKE